MDTMVSNAQVWTVQIVKNFLLETFSINVDRTEETNKVWKFYNLVNYSTIYNFTGEKKGGIEREREIETDRQTDIQTDRRMDGRTDTQTEKAQPKS